MKTSKNFYLPKELSNATKEAENPSRAISRSDLNTIDITLDELVKVGGMFRPQNLLEKQQKQF